MTSEVESERRHWRTELLVIQPTPFCNIDCSYCYLPHRTSKQRMSLELAEQIFSRLLTFPTIQDTVGLVWHAGEPMVLPVAYYEDMFALVQRLAGPKLDVLHSIQTNGTLLTDDWCDLIGKWRVNLGLSIDGPKQFHDLNRKYRNGSGSFDHAARGLRRLKERGLPFYVISVLTLASLREPDKMFDFYVENGIDNICFNIEEKEGNHTTSDLVDSREFGELYRAFLGRFFDLAARRGQKMVIREFETPFRAIQHHGTPLSNQQAEPMSIVSVDVAGNLSTFSPELLGMEHAAYGSFTFGNVITDDFETIAKRIEDSKVYTDIRAGIERCSRECKYYKLCGGGPPANKIYENNTANSTETVYCRSYQIAVDAVLDVIETKPQASHLMLQTQGAAPPQQAAREPAPAK
jgi:uncharacterized protein